MVNSIMLGTLHLETVSAAMMDAFFSPPALSPSHRIISGHVCITDRQTTKPKHSRLTLRRGSMAARWVALR